MVHIKKILKKYLGINLTKDVQDFYTENYKILLRHIKEDLNKWTCIYHVHGLEISLLSRSLHSRSVIPNIFGTRDRFHGRPVFHRQGWGGGEVVQVVMRAMRSGR